MRFLLRRPVIGAVILGIVLLSAFGLFRKVPGGLVPAEDQGYFIVAALLPDGATLTFDLPDPR